MPTRYDWVGLSDGASWPSAEWSITSGSNGTAATTLDVQAERGRFESTSSDRARRCIMQDTDVDVTLNDAEIDTEFEFMTGADDSVAVTFSLRADGAWLSDGFGPNEILPNNGYVVRLYADGRMWLRTMVDGSTQTNHIGGVDQGDSVGPDIVTRLRFQVEGDQLRVKVWAPASESEPSFSTFTDTEHASGVCAAGVASAISNFGEVRWDHLDLYDLADTATVSGQVSQTAPAFTQAVSGETTIVGAANRRVRYGSQWWPAP